MPRLRLTLAYDGRPFAGWQSQPGGNTVQDHVERAIARVLKTETGAVRIHGSGRTDAGVHALAQTAHFDAPDFARLPPDAWIRALNVCLPPAIRVMACAPAAADFHARFDATGKTYRYRIHTGPVLPPHEAGLAWHLPKPLNGERLRESCAALEGTHDFASFAAFRGNEDGTEDTVRTLHSVTPAWSGSELTLTFRGTGFLYKMVRLLTGAVTRVAAGRESPGWIPSLLRRETSGKCQHVAPADGLWLVDVEYNAAGLTPGEETGGAPGSATATPRGSVPPP